MNDIPKEIINKIVDYLIKYDNTKQLSWAKVYKEALKELEIDNQNTNILLSKVVKELTNLGYDIEGEPFKLEKYK